MNELEKFNKVWNGNFETTHWSGGIKGYTRRAYETKLKYERILFSIWRHHNDWDEVDGFQLKCFYRGCREYRTLYRVRKLAEEAGLLIKVGNYYVGDHTNYYQKNHRLFDMVFRGKDNQYGKWLEEAKKDISVDIIQVLMIEEFSKLSKENNYNLYENNSYVDMKPTGTTRKRKPKELNYDIEKLYLLSDTLFEHYYKLLIRLNNAVIHTELKFVSFIHFNQKNMPTGRPYSVFCSTLNPKKKHKDTSGEYRPEFLKRIGIPDYYEVYDIKSEIPRINWLFHTGEWKDDDYDFYTEIIKDAEFDKYLDWNLARGETKYTDYEDSMKQIFMRIYFGKRSDKDSYNGYLKDKLKRGRKDGEDFWIAQEEGFELNYDLWSVICDSTNKICGPSIGNLIFWFSFFIETEVKIELLRRGKKVYNVYDGFYYNEDIKDEIIDILDVKSRYVYNKYMKHIKIL